MVRVVNPVDDYKALLAKQALEKLRDTCGDIESGHIEADKVLCDFIAALGFKEVADEFNKIEKWYA